jgi:hypothetical protein
VLSWEGVAGRIDTVGTDGMVLRSPTDFRHLWHEPLPLPLTVLPEGDRHRPQVIGRVTRLSYAVGHYLIHGAGYITPDRADPKIMDAFGDGVSVHLDTRIISGCTLAFEGPREGANPLTVALSWRVRCIAISLHGRSRWAGCVLRLTEPVRGADA